LSSKDVLQQGSAFALTASAAATWVWYKRSNLPYNENGRYFDAENAIVFHEQDVIFYGGLALLLAAFAVCFFCLSRRY
jgi:hypothetical protein